MSEYIVDLTSAITKTMEELTATEALLALSGLPVLERITRCKDCEHMHTVRNWLGMNVCECWLHADRESGAFGKVNTEPDGFCKWAKRREEQS